MAWAVSLSHCWQEDTCSTHPSRCPSLPALSVTHRPPGRGKTQPTAVVGCRCLPFSWWNNHLSSFTSAVETALMPTAIWISALVQCDFPAPIWIQGERVVTGCHASLSTRSLRFPAARVKSKLIPQYQGAVGSSLRHHLAASVCGFWLSADVSAPVKTLQLRGRGSKLGEVVLLYLLQGKRI